MSQRRAVTAMALSAVVLLVTALVWVSTSGGEPRYDLQGSAVRIDPRPSTTAPKPAAPQASVSSAPTTTLAVGGPAPGVPVRLSIPSLGVDAPVVQVGLEKDGSMEIPGAKEAGWYRPGTRPGAGSGSAVIVAHVDHNGSPGVFIKLQRLEVGAEVTVLDDLGVARRFVVSERFQVGKPQLPTGELFRTTGAPTLTLITCGGSFNQRIRHYTDNIVVRATPVT